MSTTRQDATREVVVTMIGMETSALEQRRVFGHRVYHGNVGRVDDAERVGTAPHQIVFVQG